MWRVWSQVQELWTPCPVFCVPHQVPEGVVQPSRLLLLFLDVFNLYQLSGLCC